MHGARSIEGINRREFLWSAGAAMLCGRATTALARTAARLTPSLAADHVLRIEPTTVEIGKGVSVRTLTYNGSVPGPLLKLREGVPVTIDVENHAATAEIVHWHGLVTDTLNDGACEEGSPMVPSGGTLRYHLQPRPAGTRWYHTHASAFDNLATGTYTGQFGFLLVEGGGGGGPAYDQEVNLAVHHWEPSFVPMASMMRQQSANLPLTAGSDVAYRYATVNAHMLGAGEPIRVKQGQRVLMRLLNASATENVILALPGHHFHVLAMDGNPVPTPASVERLSLGVGERVDAIVEMNAPGIWVLGSTLAKERAMGLGIVIEYAGRSGEPVWLDPPAAAWDYSQFAGTSEAARPDETHILTFRDIGPLRDSKFDTWTINNKSWPEVDPVMVQAGRRHRLVFRNGSGDQHPMHIHRHSFEVVSIGDKKMSGLMKDVVNVMPLETVTVDMVANNPGDSLMHCHMQLHMDYGFMQMIKYRG
jgi:FtsP/CotA-like multicopper oxidase with cupredoxin domain